MMMFITTYALYYYIRPDPCPRSQACSPQETEVTRSLGRLSLGLGSLNKIPVMMITRARALSLHPLLTRSGGKQYYMGKEGDGRRLAPLTRAALQRGRSARRARRHRLEMSTLAHSHTRAYARTHIATTRIRCHAWMHPRMNTNCVSTRVHDK